MPLKKYKDGKLIEEIGTKQPTTEQAEQIKQKQIAEQNELLEKINKERKAESPVAASAKSAAATNKIIPAASE